LYVHIYAVFVHIAARQLALAAKVSDSAVALTYIRCTRPTYCEFTQAATGGASECHGSGEPRVGVYYCTLVALIR
jgi:hypothetical protein